jgi:hypothetical protein
MFRSIDRSPRRRNRAVTLIEAVLYISIALALIVGGLVFFQQASTSAKTSATVRQLSATLAETRVLIKGTPLTDNPTNQTDITSFLISSGAVPSDMVASPTSLSNPFGGNTRFSAYEMIGYPVVTVELTDVPQGVCTRLITATSTPRAEWDWGPNTIGHVGVTTIVSSGYFAAQVAATGSTGIWNNFIMNASQAGWMCKYGSGNYPVKTTQPTSTPISGNVDVRMHFMVQ